MGASQFLPNYPRLCLASDADLLPPQLGELRDKLSGDTEDVRNLTMKQARIVIVQPANSLLGRQFTTTGPAEGVERCLGMAHRLGGLIIQVSNGVVPLFSNERLALRGQDVERVTRSRFVVSDAKAPFNERSRQSEAPPFGSENAHVMEDRADPFRPNLVLVTEFSDSDVLADGVRGEQSSLAVESFLEVEHTWCVTLWKSELIVLVLGMLRCIWSGQLQWLGSSARDGPSITHDLNTPEMNGVHVSAT